MITPINDFDRARIKNAYSSMYGVGRNVNESVCNEREDDDAEDSAVPGDGVDDAGDVVDDEAETEEEEEEEELVSDLTPDQCRRVDKAWHKFLDKVRFEPCVDTADGLIHIYFNKDTGVFEYGRATDDGIVAEGGVAYDMDVPLSENLDNVVDEIHDEYGFPEGEESEDGESDDTDSDGEEQPE